MGKNVAKKKKKKTSQGYIHWLLLFSCKKNLEACILYSELTQYSKSGHLKRDKTKVLIENGSLMKVESIAECSPWSILQYL